MCSPILKGLERFSMAPRSGANFCLSRRSTSSSISRFSVSNCWSDGIFCDLIGATTSSVSARQLITKGREFRNAVRRPISSCMRKSGLSAWVLPVTAQLAMQVHCGRAATDRLLAWHLIMYVGRGRKIKSRVPARDTRLFYHHSQVAASKLAATASQFTTFQKAAI